jgi:uncharacterized protein (DUF111 family)
LKREELTVDSPWGKMRVKKTITAEGKTGLLPEYEECKRIAQDNNLALRDVYAWAAALSKHP